MAREIKGDVFAGIEMTEARYASIAGHFGLVGDALIASRWTAADRHATALKAALGASAFGVPIFRTEDGATFFGNDRWPLLQRHKARA